MSEYEKLRQAVESFIIAETTCNREDAANAYRELLRIAKLESYL